MPTATSPPRASSVEIVRPERIVLEHVSGPPLRADGHAGEQAGTTLLTWRMRFASAAECDRVRRLAVEANEPSLDRSQTRLAMMAQG